MTRLHPFIRRLILSLAIGIVAALIISEGSYQLLRDDIDREPQQIDIVVPAGAAEQVAAGQSVVPLPDDMIFVMGDVLAVKNEDVVDHQLGPVWVPAGSTGSLVLDQANKYTYGCTFVPSRYLGLDVRPRGTSLQSRVLALAFVSPPTIVLILLYGILIVPLRESTSDHNKLRNTESNVRVSQPGIVGDDPSLHARDNGKAAN